MPEAAQLSPAQQRELEEKLKQMSPEELQDYQKQQCIFCQIISGKIPAHKVYEDKTALAILDIYPARLGHVLVVPKEHYGVLPQVPAQEIAHLFTLAKQMSHAQLRGLRVEGTSIFVANGVVAGQKSAHFVVHVIPRVTGDELLEILPKKFDPEKVKALYPRLVNTLSRLVGAQKEVMGLPTPEPEKRIAAKPEQPLERRKEEAPDTEEPVEEEPEEKKGGVSLDDIARLFQ